MIELNDISTYVQDYMTRSYLALACDLFGDTEDALSIQSANLPDDLLKMIRKQMGLSVKACELPNNYDPTNYKKCAD